MQEIYLRRSRIGEERGYTFLYNKLNFFQVIAHPLMIIFDRQHSPLYCIIFCWKMNKDSITLSLTVCIFDNFSRHRLRPCFRFGRKSALPLKNPKAEKKAASRRHILTALTAFQSINFIERGCYIPNLLTINLTWCYPTNRRPTVCLFYR